jgi:hypothetical protein
MRSPTLRFALSEGAFDALLGNLRAGNFVDAHGRARTRLSLRVRREQQVTSARSGRAVHGCRLAGVQTGDSTEGLGQDV